jgi:hypothetical protein
MVEALINDKALAERKVAAYWERLKPFYTGDAAFAPVCMACLAAFPVVLTADLAYQLWANFRELQDLKGNKHRLPPLVVSDCILSPLWRNTGSDVFELDPDTRAYLLDGLRKKFGDAIIDDLASFLYNYIDEKKDSRMPASFAEAQQWTALLAVDAPEAARQILNALNNKLSEGRFGEGMGISNLLATLSRDSNELAEMMRSSMREPINKDTTAGTLPVDKRIRIQEASGSNAFSIDIPDELAGPLMPLLDTGSENSIGMLSETNSNRQIFTILIAVDEYQFIDKKLTKSVTDAEAIAIRLESEKMLSGGQQRLTKSYNRKATRNNVLSNLRETLKSAGPGDWVIIYFCGTIGIDQDKHYLLLHDSKTGTEGIESGISNEVLQSILSEFGRQDPNVLLILDACNSGTPDWLMTSNPKHIGLMSSQAAQLSFESPSMTDILLEVFANGRRAITYREVYLQLLSKLDKQVPYFKISRNKWDTYFLSTVDRDPVLTAKQLLLDLGYPLYADNNPSDPAFNKAILEFAPASNASSQSFTIQELVRRATPALRRANLMRKAAGLGIVYLHIEEPAPDLDIMQSDITESHRQEGVKMSLERIEGAKVDFVAISEFSDENWNSLRKKILSNQWLLIGINNRWINNKQLTAAIESLLELAFACDRLVDFVLEEECDWRRPPITAYSVLPDSLRPITDPVHRDRMLEQIHSNIPGLTQYIGLKTPKQVDQRFEKRLREARRTGHLDLSGMDLYEFPASVYLETSITSLDCSHNHIAAIPRGIAQLSSVRRLNLSDNPLDHLPAEICYLSQLTELNVADTALSDFPAEMYMLRQLDKLDLRGTPMRMFNAGAFGDHFPAEVRFPEKGCYNLPNDIRRRNELAKHLLRVQEKPFVVMEIHSESARPRYQHFLRNLSDECLYYFFENVNTLPELFKHLYGLAGSKHTIVYLCDSKNILGPQFVDTANSSNLSYSFFKALGKKIGLIANNGRIHVGSIADLVGGNEMDFGILTEDNNHSEFVMADKLIQGLADGLSFKTAFDAAVPADSTELRPRYRLSSNFENYSLPLALVRRASNTTKKSAQKPAAENPAKIPFSGKRILVTGTWHQKLMSTGEYSVVHAIGKLLAEEGYGLITGGYPGIDEEVALYFAETLGTLRINSKDRLIQVLSTSDKPSFKGDSSIQRVKQKEWTDRVLNMSAAVIVIGGSRLVEQTVNDAIKKNIPVLPVAESGKVARQVYDKLYNESGFNFLPTQINALAAGLTNKGLVELIAGIRSILKGLPSIPVKPTAVRKPAKKSPSISSNRKQPMRKQAKKK